MNKVIILSVGISILFRLERFGFKDKLNSIKNISLDHSGLFINKVNDLTDDILKTEEILPHKLGAEMNSLEKLGVQKGDKLFFLISHEPDGKLVGELLTKLSKSYWKVDANYIMVQGLQVKNADKFFLIGIPNLVEHVGKIIEKYPSSNYIRMINTTGGYKAIAFYLTMLGMLEGLQVKYLFEMSDEVIEIPATPVYFDFESLYRLGINHARHMVRHKLNEQELARLTGRNIKMLRQEFKDVLVWDSNKQVTLSPLARLD